MSRHLDSFKTRAQLTVGDQTYTIFRLDRLGVDIQRYPYSIRVLLENLLRNEDGLRVTRRDVEALLAWNPQKPSDDEISFMPSRVILQDFTGVPAVVDLAAMRDAIESLGGDPARINPVQPVDLVIDHSVQVDFFGTPQAAHLNAELEFERNLERYVLLRWGQGAFKDFRVVPPDTGIVHQVNLEYLADVVSQRLEDGTLYAFPDTLVGTDSHTTMINGLGVLGWGVGGIEAEAAMLNQPCSMVLPEVIGFRLEGQLPPGATATDLVLTATQMLRKRGVVGRFVEFYGPGLARLSLADRATLANMAPEYGATMGFCPVDEETLNYLRFSGRDEAQVALVEAYCRAQGLFRTDDAPDPIFTDSLTLELGSVKPSLAGPKRPQDRVLLSESKKVWRQGLSSMAADKGTAPAPEDLQAWIAGQAPAPGSFAREVPVSLGDSALNLKHGAVVIAAITSCTNTSNPSVLIAAGLLAQKAVAKGLTTQPWVKTSLAPGSQVVADYLEAAGLQGSLDALRFHIVGYGCTTCIGNSGPLPEPISAGIKAGSLVAVSVLSGNRNFEGRINPFVRANYLASPPLVVAYALAGTMDIDLDTEPLGKDQNGNPVFLKDIWPSHEEIKATMERSVRSEMFRQRYGNVFAGDRNWQALQVPEGERFAWDASSTYIKRPSFFENMTLEPAPLQGIDGARVLALLGDSVTTDHISPAGNIAQDGPAARYLMERGVKPRDFNSFGARRGNHEVMVRGTFANIRLKNLLVPGVEGGVTRHLPDGAQCSIYDGAMQYQADGVPLLIIAGAEYGTGSSRDWAAKGTMLLGVRAVIARSFERIHRSNLVGMGVLPLQFLEGQDASSLGLTGLETYSLEGLDELAPGRLVTVKVQPDEGPARSFQVKCRIDTPQELLYYQHGGILPYSLRQIVKGRV